MPLPSERTALLIRSGVIIGVQLVLKLKMAMMFIKPWQNWVTDNNPAMVENKHLF